jgi:hypothetical protein
MLGIDEATAPFGMDPCISTKALWGQEYARTTIWGDHSADCEKKPHCGFMFMPEPSAQSSYLAHAQGIFKCPNKPGSEGSLVTSASINWSFILSRSICSIIKHEGHLGGHLGPFIRRTIGGFAFWKAGDYWGNIKARWGGHKKCPRPDIFPCN